MRARLLRLAVPVLGMIALGAATTPAKAADFLGIPLWESYPGQYSYNYAPYGYRSYNYEPYRYRSDYYAPYGSNGYTPSYNYAPTYRGSYPDSGYNNGYYDGYYAQTPLGQGSGMGYRMGR